MSGRETRFAPGTAGGPGRPGASKLITSTDPLSAAAAKGAADSAQITALVVEGKAAAVEAAKQEAKAKKAATDAEIAAATLEEAKAARDVAIKAATKTQNASRVAKERVEAATRILASLSSPTPTVTKAIQEAVEASGRAAKSEIESYFALTKAIRVVKDKEAAAAAAATTSAGTVTATGTGDTPATGAAGAAVAAVVAAPVAAATAAAPTAAPATAPVTPATAPATAAAAPAKTIMIGGRLVSDTDGAISAMLDAEILQILPTIQAVINAFSVREGFFVTQLIEAARARCFGPRLGFNSKCSMAQAIVATLSDEYIRLAGGPGVPVTGAAPLGVSGEGAAPVSRAVTTTATELTAPVPAPDAPPSPAALPPPPPAAGAGAGAVSGAPAPPPVPPPSGDAAPAAADTAAIGALTARIATLEGEIARLATAAAGGAPSPGASRPDPGYVAELRAEDADLSTRIGTMASSANLGAARANIAGLQARLTAAEATAASRAEEAAAVARAMATAAAEEALRKAHAETAAISATARAAAEEAADARVRAANAEAAAAAAATAAANSDAAVKAQIAAASDAAAKAADATATAARTAAAAAAGKPEEAATVAAAAEAEAAAAAAKKKSDDDAAAAKAAEEEAAAAAAMKKKADEEAAAAKERSEKAKADAAAKEARNAAARATAATVAGAGIKPTPSTSSLKDRLDAAIAEAQAMKVEWARIREKDLAEIQAQMQAKKAREEEIQRLRPKAPTEEDRQADAAFRASIRKLVAKTKADKETQRKAHTEALAAAEVFKAEQAALASAAPTEVPAEVPALIQTLAKELAEEDEKERALDVFLAEKLAEEDVLAEAAPVPPEPTRRLLYTIDVPLSLLLGATKMEELKDVLATWKTEREVGEEELGEGAAAAVEAPAAEAAVEAEAAAAVEAEAAAAVEAEAAAAVEAPAATAEVAEAAAAAAAAAEAATEAPAAATTGGGRPAPSAAFFAKQGADLSCGRQALNNLLGNEYFVRGAYPPTETYNMASFTNANPPPHPISLSTVCKTLHDSGITAEPLATYCLPNEYYDTNVLTAALNMMGYTASELTLDGVRTSHLDGLFIPPAVNTLTGFLLNLGGYHWTAYKKTGADQFTYYDSLTSGPGKNITDRELRDLLRKDESRVFKQIWTVQHKPGTEYLNPVEILTAMKAGEKAVQAAAERFKQVKVQAAEDFRYLFKNPAVSLLENINQIADVSGGIIQKAGSSEEIFMFQSILQGLYNNNEKGELAAQIQSLSFTDIQNLWQLSMTLYLNSTLGKEVGKTNIGGIPNFYELVFSNATYEQFTCIMQILLTKDDVRQELATSLSSKLPADLTRAEIFNNFILYPIYNKYKTGCGSEKTSE